MLPLCLHIDIFNIESRKIILVLMTIILKLEAKFYACLMQIRLGDHPDELNDCKISL